VIYIVHPLRNIDISAALPYGEPYYINTRYVYPDEIGEDGRIPSPFRTNIYAAASRFDPAKDYLLIGAGDDLQLTEFIAVLSSYGNAFRVLRYDRKAEGYLPVTIYI